LRHLAVHGWITLRQVAPLVGLKPTSIYPRQRTKRAIPTILIGGTYRVYKDTVIELLNNAPEEDQEASQYMLLLYNRYKKEHNDE
jgi:hypothetical protein